jgi:hypothetical protein
MLSAKGRIIAKQRQNFRKAAIALTIVSTRADIRRLPGAKGWIFAREAPAPQLAGDSGKTNGKYMEDYGKPAAKGRQL